MWFRKNKNKQIYIVPAPNEPSKELPYCWKEVKKNLGGSGIDLHYKHLKHIPRKVDLVVVENFCYVTSVLGDLKKIRPKQCILIQWEPAAVDPSGHAEENHRYFSRVYTVRNDIADGHKYFQFHFPSAMFRIEDEIPFEKKKLLTMVVGNKASIHPDELYSARREAIEFFEKVASTEFTFYGTRWDKENYKSYGGSPIDKIHTIKNYRFSICYENQKEMPGYITEKIWNCFQAKNVPVYWGAPNVADYIPRECMIRKEDFESLDDLYTFLKNMDEQQYQGYLDAVGQFFQDKNSHKFSYDAFAVSMAEQLTSTVSRG